MTPILGITASQMSAHLWAPGTDFDSIATTTLSTTASSITFSSIPATYRHLQVRMLVKGSGQNLEVGFNSDTGSNYNWHYLLGDGATASASGIGTTAAAIAMQYTDVANTFAAGVMDILDYADTNKYKTVRTLSGYDENGSGRVALWSDLWRNTNAVNTVTLKAGTLFKQYSSFALYGVK